MAASYPPYPQNPVPPPAESPAFVSPFKTSGPVARWVYAGGTLLMTGALAGYLFLVDPNNPDNAYPKCPLKALTGLDCPGCGGLRATHSLVHGDIMGAIDHNILAVFIVPLMAYFILRWVLGLFGKTLPKVPSRPFLSWALPVGILVFSVLRNIPWGPFYYFNSASA